MNHITNSIKYWKQRDEKMSSLIREYYSNIVSKQQYKIFANDKNKQKILINRIAIWFSLYCLLKLS